MSDSIKKFEESTIEEQGKEVGSINHTSSQEVNYIEEDLSKNKKCRFFLKLKEDVTSYYRTENISILKGVKGETYLFENIELQEVNNFLSKNASIYLDYSIHSVSGKPITLGGNYYKYDLEKYKNLKSAVEGLGLEFFNTSEDVHINYIYNPKLTKKQKKKLENFRNQINSLEGDKNIKDLEELAKKLAKTPPQQGKKDNNYKLPMSKLFVQFPRALQAVVLTSCYGHNRYLDSDQDWLNFSRVKGGSNSYSDAEIRHILDKEIYGNEDESGLPHIFHQLFNKLAECELYIKENNIDIKEYSKKYLKNLAQQNDK